jgi:predicted XRE-type DNA-binding protein
MMMEFSDLWQTTNRAENVRIRAKIADAVDRWIESHVKLIGEIFFCDDPNGK